MACIVYVYMNNLTCALQKLSALSSSLARVVSSVEEDEAQMDHFPVEGVRIPSAVLQPSSLALCIALSRLCYANFFIVLLF